MLVSLTWIQELLHTKLDAQKLAKLSLTLGLEVEDIKHLAPEGIVIGHVRDRTPHPTHAQLSVLQIKTHKQVQIVTADQNVRVNDYVLVGPAGIHFNEQRIEEKDFDGVRSQGMLISEQELGLAEQSTGVIILADGKPGESFKDVFDNTVLDMSTTPNRPDWLSIEGIARDLAIGMGIDYAKFSPSRKLYLRKQTNCSGLYKIAIKDADGCPRYTARIFENVTVKQSPFWMKWRLHCMGMHSINNVVDVTNIVMLLTGQSLHPFDCDLLKGSIVIRNAHKAEEFITLEGTKFTLEKDDLLITDNKGPIALAGIIGAQRAQISQSTKRVLLESAYFNPKRIAHTSRRIDLITEASMRFEEKADLAIVDAASALAAEMLKTYAGAKERDYVSVGKKAKPIIIKFSPQRLNKILSLSLTTAQIKTILKKVGIKTLGTAAITTTIPHYRRDLLIEEDIYEEVARLYGYMNIPEIPPQRWGGRVVTDKSCRYEEIIRNYLIGHGFSEAYNLSLLPSKRLYEYGFDSFVKITNPLNERFDALRPTLFVGLLDNVNYNLSKGNRFLRLFEIGNILTKHEPYQQKRLGVILGGARFKDYWKHNGDQLDYYDAKGTLEGIFHLLRIKDINFQKNDMKPFNQNVTINVAGKNYGHLGFIDQAYCKEPFYYFELYLEPLLVLANEPFYIPPAKFPANTRDLSFLVNEQVEVPDVIQRINKVGGPVLEKVTLFDYYKGKSLSPGIKNIGFRLFFRAPDRTLTDKEVDAFVNRIEQELSGTFDAKLRKKE